MKYIKGGIIGTIIFSIIGVGVVIGQDAYEKSIIMDRKSKMEELFTAISMYKGKHIAPPINQYGLEVYEMVEELPRDPINGHLFQYNCDLRGWTKSYPDQCGTTGDYIIATNVPTQGIDDNNGFILTGYGKEDLLTKQGVNYENNTRGGREEPLEIVECGTTEGNMFSITGDTEETQEKLVSEIKDNMKEGINLIVENVLGDYPGSACVINISGKDSPVSIEYDNEKIIEFKQNNDIGVIEDKNNKEEKENYIELLKNKYYNIGHEYNFNYSWIYINSSKSNDEIDEEMKIYNEIVRKQVVKILNKTNMKENREEILINVNTKLLGDINKIKDKKKFEELSLREKGILSIYRVIKEYDMYLSYQILEGEGLDINKFTKLFGKEAFIYYKENILLNK